MQKPQKSTAFIFFKLFFSVSLSYADVTCDLRTPLLLALFSWGKGEGDIVKNQSQHFSLRPESQ
ncbi:hypothetical protein QQP08_025628 [Theobroma cacao]|nr:hypothetical protein QQP08_025628 [Theobroma cacao]